MQRKPLIEYDFSIEQYPTPSFSLYTYFITSNGEAALIDPIYEPTLYEDLWNETNTVLKFIFLTHIPFEFKSNYETLSKQFNAEVIGGVVNKNITVFKVGKISIKQVSTPGFTFDSSCFLWTNSKNEEKAIFTGGVLTLSCIGYPFSRGSQREDSVIAEECYTSLETIKTINPKCWVYPGYGPDSICGGNVKPLPRSWLSTELSENEFLKMNKDAFSKALLPLIQSKSHLLRHVCLRPIETDFLSTITPLPPSDVLKYCNDKSVVLIDTRDFSDSSKCFIKNSILLSLKVSFIKFLLSTVTPTEKVLFITDKDKWKDTLWTVIRLGYCNIVGYLEDGVEECRRWNSEWIDSIHGVAADIGVPQCVKEGKLIIDIRESVEHKDTGVIKGSKLIPWTTWREKVEEIDKDRDIYVTCRGGIRALIGISYWKRQGITKCDWFNLTGGTMKWIGSGFKMEEYNEG